MCHHSIEEKFASELPQECPEKPNSNVVLNWLEAISLMPLKSPFPSIHQQPRKHLQHMERLMMMKEWLYNQLRNRKMSMITLVVSTSISVQPFSSRSRILSFTSTDIPSSALNRLLLESFL